MIQLAEHFGDDSRGAHSEQLQRKRWFIKARHDRQQRELLDDRVDENLTAFASAAVLATEIQIEEFQAKLDTYDEATVIALIENQEQLDAVNAHLLEMLERAYVMEDGRRVFKTADGTQVFDEFGKEITPDELDFDLIRPDQPTWESFSERKAQQQQLEVQRKQILEFQERVDKARERVDEGKITKSELDDLDAELADAVPPSVKAHMPGFDTTENAPVARTAFAANANPVTLARIIHQAFQVSSGREGLTGLTAGV